MCNHSDRGEDGGTDADVPAQTGDSPRDDQGAAQPVRHHPELEHHAPVRAAATAQHTSRGAGAGGGGNRRKRVAQRTHKIQQSRYPRFSAPSITLSMNRE